MRQRGETPTAIHLTRLQLKRADGSKPVRDRMFRPRGACLGPQASKRIRTSLTFGSSPLNSSTCHLPSNAAVHGPRATAVLADPGMKIVASGRVRRAHGTQIDGSPSGMTMQGWRGDQFTQLISVEKATGLSGRGTGVVGQRRAVAVAVAVDRHRPQPESRVGGQLSCCHASCTKSQVPTLVVTSFGRLRSSPRTL